jgi:hypothetical protein
MTVSAVTSASLWDQVNFPGSLNTEPRARRGGTASEGTAGSVQPASVQFGSDSYTPGTPSNAHKPVTSSSDPANLAALTGSNTPVNLQGTALVNGIPPSMLGAGISAASNGVGQTTAGASSIADGEVLSQLDAAISAAAADGSQDSNWMNDLVSYASGLDGGTSSVSGGAGAGGALASDLSTIQGVIQKVTAQVSSALAAQGAAPGLLSAAVNALTTSLTLNSLGAVAQQIAERTGSPNTFTVTSSVVTIAANGASVNANTAGETESFSGASGSLTLTTTGGAMSVTGANVAAGNGNSVSGSGFGYRFSISESGPGESAYAGTSDIQANATATSSNGASEDASATAALDEGSTVYENADGTEVVNNTALVLASDWAANLESTATQNTVNSADSTSGSQAQPAQSGSRTMADFFNAAAHVLFKQALALLEGIFGAGNSNVVNETGLGQFVDVYA